MPQGSNAKHIKVDEKAGICIVIGRGGSLTVAQLFSGTSLWCLPKLHVRCCRRCEYDNGYLVFNNRNGEKEVWRLASDFSAKDEVAVDAPPSDTRRSKAMHRPHLLVVTMLLHTRQASRQPFYGRVCLK
ncbi:hypothetical protein EI94DRAFT_1189315 [Lactarius quietus]|nr:hypothetical protein EI94DRAFT_1189315 [Lactarius quietus]